MIDHSTIQRIFEVADIVEVISEFVNLKKAGSNYKALSPFTNEKTPSFIVSPSKQIFKCFSSGMGGNVVKFLMEHEKISYPEALRYLAKKYNIEIEEKERTEEEIKLESDRESMLVLNAFAQKYFTDTLLNHTEGKTIGMSYIRERGISENMVEKFKLGYCPDQKNAFTETAIRKGYKAEFLIKTGLTIQKENYRFDRFSGRLIFPIVSLSGKILGFGGRILKTSDKTAKYLNSPESDIYHKGKILYGLYEAKKSIVLKDKCYLVEGYTDVIAMHQAGIENVVASSGTALTQDQIRLLKRFTNNITIIFDGDEAGVKASFRGIDMVLEEGLNIKVLMLPDEEDPDSFSKKHSSTEFQEFIEKGQQDFITFKTKYLAKEGDNDPVSRSRLISDIIRSVSVIPDNITRSVYIKECSKILEVDEQQLYAEINRIRNKKFESKRRNIPSGEIKKASQKPITGKRLMEDNYILEKDIIRLLLNYGAYILFTEEDTEKGELKEITTKDFIINEFEKDAISLSNPMLVEIFKEFKSNLTGGEGFDERYFIHHQNEKIASVAADLLSTSYTLSNIWKKRESYFETEEMRLQEIVTETVIAYKNKKVLDELHMVEKQLKEAQEKKDADQIDALMQRLIKLNKLKTVLAKSLGGRTILK